MVIEIYIEAILADEEKADGIWDLWDAGFISDYLAMWAWSQIVSQARNDR